MSVLTAVALMLALAPEGGPLVLSPDDAVALAIDNSPTLARFEEHVREEEAWRAGALRLDNPSLRVRHHAPEHLVNPWTGPPWGQPGNDYPLNGSRVDLRWSPPSLDAFGARQTEGDHRIERRQAELHDARAELDDDVRALHARILHLQRGLALAEEAVSLSARTDALVRRLREEGLATVLDVSLAQLDAFDAVAEREARKRELSDEVLQLRGKLGVEPGRALELSAPAESLCRVPDEAPAELVARAAEGSWKLKAIDAERLAEEAERDAYVLDRIPWFDFVQASVIPGDGNDDTTIGVSVGVELPILDLRFDDEARADARVGALKAERRIERAGLDSRVVRAHERLAAQVALVELYRGAQAAVIDEGLAHVEKALAAGQLDASSVALVQRRALRAKREALDAAWECDRAALRLRRLTAARSD